MQIRQNALKCAKSRCFSIALLSGEVPVKVQHSFSLYLHLPVTHWYVAVAQVFRTEA
jgi:hypothetical protein